MNLSSVAVNQLQKRLPKVIDARTHGLIDYAHCAFFFTVGALMWRRNRRAAAAALGTGAFVLVQSLLTDYPLGATPVISLAEHGKMDAALAATSPLIPRLFGFSGTGAARIFEANGVVAAAVVGMTDFDGKAAQRGRGEGEDYWNYTADAHTDRVA